MSLQTQNAKILLPLSSSPAGRVGDEGEEKN
jgi:hypothetical protein